MSTYVSLMEGTRQLYLTSHTNSKHRSLNLYETLTFSRHVTRRETPALHKHNVRIVITNMNCPRIKTGINVKLEELISFTCK